ncbi:hypothetical protein R3P38DRAFT_770396 [Favolaschia claudopus]|uniref:F-box domain-containing protein n=1 Tax=Favolaschia claudopus TaxID=2862362 RepID=A0AAW0C0F6_9AGAR
MASIPLDVLLEILPFVDRVDLPAMARSNRYLSHYALDQIYGHIASKHMQAACLSTTSNPALAQRVKFLELNRAVHGLQLQAILPFVRDALRVCSNLQTLKLDVDGNHSWVLPTGPERGVFKLRAFSCATFITQDLLEFLRDQDELEDISFSHSYLFTAERGPPRPWRFPLLKKFEGPMSWIDTIVPNHPVSNITVSYVKAGAASSLAALELTTVPIRHLQIPLHALQDRDLEGLGALFPSLEVLILTVALTWPKTTPSASILHFVRDLLGVLSTVQIFEIIGFTASNEAENDSLLHVVQTATEKGHPSLRQFSVQYRDGYGTNTSRVYWTKADRGWERQ